jgi:hypothetical protein
MEDQLDKIVVQIPAKELLEIDAALGNLAIVRSQYGDDEGVTTALALKKRLTNHYRYALEKKS